MATKKTKKSQAKRKSQRIFAYVPTIQEKVYNEPSPKGISPFRPVLINNLWRQPNETNEDIRKKAIQQIRQGGLGSGYYESDLKTSVRKKDIPNHRVHLIPVSDAQALRAWYKGWGNVGNENPNYGQVIVQKEFERLAIQNRARKRKIHGSLRHYVPRR